MRILIALALATAVMAALVVVILAIGSAVTKAAGDVAARGPVQSGFVSKVAFVLLWLLVAGISAGLIGGA